MENKINKVINLVLTFILVFIIILTNVNAQSNTINIDGFNIEIIQNDSNKVVARIVNDNEIFTMSHTMHKDDYVLKKEIKDKVFISRMFSNFPKVETYKVDVKTFNNNNLVATIKNNENNEEI